MTIPTLISEYQDRVTVTKLKKMYSTLTNAYSLYLVDNGSTGRLERTEADAIKAFEVFKPYLKLSRDCGTDTGESCGIYTGIYKLKNGTDKDTSGNPLLSYKDKTYYKAALSDGSSIWFRGSASNNFNIDIFYDVNGANPPNQWGHDLFEFLVTDGKVYPNGLPDTQTENFDEHCAPANSEGYGCAAWVIYKGNLDYIKCDDLTWEDSGC